MIRAGERTAPHAHSYSHLFMVQMVSARSISTATSHGRSRAATTFLFPPGARTLSIRVKTWRCLLGRICLKLQRLAVLCEKRGTAF
ncbi:hypothetical protein XH92_14695 [Bradyrhizobium sp. CCBAU 53421]|nr:hypothetical protein XH92_14695 [Bradyrhizobium sp. CCBAU 53421]